MNNHVYNLIMSYIDKGISVIPCKLVWDQKEQKFSGKFPAISGWQTYCDRLATDEEVEQWASIPNVSGIAIAMGKASGLACIDIDTDDQKVIDSVLDFYFSSCLIKGAKDRYGKMIFKLPKNYDGPSKIKQDHPASGKRLVDVFFDKSYIVAPPSVHSKFKDGSILNYEWSDSLSDITRIDMDDIPELNDPDIQNKLSQIALGLNANEMASMNYPTGGIDLSGVGQEGRWSAMKSFCGGLIKSGESMDIAVAKMLEKDKIENGGSYFTDKTKGNFKESEVYNCIMYYCSMLKTVNARKSKDDMELPKFLSLKTFNAEAVDWGEIIPIEKETSLPPFNLNWIPNDHIRDMVSTGAEVTAVSPQCIFMYLLGAFSSVIGNKVMVQPYHMNEDFVEPCNLYVGIVASSGERKSETTNIALTPLRRLDKTVKEANKQKQKDTAQLSKDLNTRINKLTKNRQKEIEENGLGGEFSESILEEIRELEKQRPIIKNVSLIEQRYTAEKLYEIAEDNPSGLFIDINEWGPKYHQLQAKEASGERTFLLDGWDGKKSFSYKTKHHGSNVIDKLNISVGFSCQYDVIQSILWRVQNIQKESDGLMQRFLMVCSDDLERPILDKKYVIKEEVHEIFEKAYYIEEKSSPVLLDMPAYHKWMEFQKQTQRKKVNEKNTSLASAISKYDGLIIRIACCLETMAQNGNRPECISEASFDIALEMMAYLEAHLRYLFNVGEVKNLKEIVRQMQMSIIPDETTVRELYKFHTGLFGNSSDEARNVLKILFEHNVIRFYKEGKSEKIRINPRLRG